MHFDLRKTITTAAGFTMIAAGAVTGVGMAQAAPAVPPSSMSEQTPPAGVGTPDGPSIAPNGNSRAVAAECRLHTWPVAQSGGSVFVRGGRFDCANFATYNVEMRKVRNFQPDDRLSTVGGSGNGSVVASSACRGAGTYFGQTFSSTGSNYSGARGQFC